MLGSPAPVCAAVPLPGHVPGIEPPLRAGPAPSSRAPSHAGMTTAECEDR